MSRRSNQFSSVRTEGGLLPQDLLSRIQSGDKTLAGLSPESYHLGPHERVGEAVNRAWSRLTATWHAFEEALAKEADVAMATGLTRDRWLLPLFQELGYGRLPKGHAIEVEGKSFAVSHTWHQSPIHLLGAGVDLDRRQAGVAGAAKASPHGLVQEFLNRSDEHLWGFVSNGLQLRVLRDHHSLTRQAYVEFDLQAIMQGEQYSEFLLLWMVCHQSRVEAEKPEECWLETWFNTSRDEGVRALDKLRGGVEKAIEAFGTGFLADKSNAKLREALESGELDKQEYYRQVLRLVYRLIFLFVAEEREALLDPDADEAAKNRYLKYYATRRIRALADKRRGGPHGDVWQGLRFVMSRLDDGCPELALPALGSRLWSARACPALMDAECGNDHVLEAIRLLSNIQEGRTRYPVNWRNVGADELGSIYEGLLELHPRLNKEAGTFVLDTAAGHERKTTGSYYTPTELVDSLLDSALEPVLDEACKQANPEETILDLKVCDPACGSGHFLVAATRRVAKRLAAVRAGEDEPSPKDVQHALRDVVGRCIYGVDVNPMAVELCKVSLWMEAIEPGRPLSFLDSHIQRGNALLGATPALMSRGIPDVAFKSIESDDSNVAKRLKKRNAQERKGQTTLFALIADHSASAVDAVATQAAQVEQATDNDIAAVREKERRWERLSRSAEFKDAWIRADAWCSAFVWPKREGELENGAPTQTLWQRLQKDVTAAPQVTRRTVRDLAREYRFFHWHLAFPTVFADGTSQFAETDATGWRGGFDVVVGNPPWDRLKLEEKEWFSGRSDDVVRAKTAAARRKKIASLEKSDPLLYGEFQRARRQSEGASQFARSSGRYPLMATGDINKYALFVETNAAIRSATGAARVGCIAPTGVATDKNTRAFFGHLLSEGLLVSLIDFENRKQIFPGVQGNMRFCLLTFGSNARVTFRIAAQLDETRQLGEEGRFYELSTDDVVHINPNTMNCPMFTNRRHAELNKGVYERFPVFVREQSEAVNPWGIEFSTMFHLTNASHLFRTREQLLDEGMHLEGNTFRGNGTAFVPLYEAKLAYQFNHRASTYEGIAADVRFRTHAGTRRLESEHLADPEVVVEPRYWVADREVAEQAGDRKWFLTFRDVISAVADSRSLVAAIVPRSAIGNTMPIVEVADRPKAIVLVAILNSFVMDYLLRQKAVGGHLNYYIFKQLPAPAPETFDAPCPWDSRLSQRAWVSARSLELTYTAWDLEPFARDNDCTLPPLRWDENRRFLLRAELDAALFQLYGVERADVDYVMETFPIVKRRDVQEHGDYRTKLQILEIYDRLAQATERKEPYETTLDPGPADARVAHPPRGVQA